MAMRAAPLSGPSAPSRTGSPDRSQWTATPSTGLPHTPRPPGLSPPTMSAGRPPPPPPLSDDVLAGHLADAVDGVDDVHVPRGAADLAVGGGAGRCHGRSWRRAARASGGKLQVVSPSSRAR